MKSIYKKLGILTTIFFAFGLIFVAFFLYTLPQTLLQNVVAIDYDTVAQLQPVMTKLNWVVGAVLSLGLIALILTIFNDRTGNNDNLVYVETFKEKKQNEEKIVQEDSDSINYKDALDEIEAILSQKEGEKDAVEKAFSVLCKKVEACQGALFLKQQEDEGQYFDLFTSFAYTFEESKNTRFELGEGLPGQVAKEGKLVNLSSVPEGYIKILSGLGNATPQHLVLAPIVANGNTKGVAEFAAFAAFSPHQEKFIAQVCDLLFSKQTGLQEEVKKPSKRKVNIAQ